ncbi:MAG: hypothetical protein U0Z53_09495 [Blastocatellia bacterium]
MAAIDAGKAALTNFRADQDFTADVTWDCDSAPLPEGEWLVKIFAETADRSAGTESFLLAETRFPCSADAASSHNFSVPLRIPAGTLSAGAYRLVTVVTQLQPERPGRLAGFRDEPVIRFY